MTVNQIAAHIKTLTYSEMLDFAKALSDAFNKRQVGVSERVTADALMDFARANTPLFPVGVGVGAWGTD